jgi:hypothetical protein
MSRPVTPPAAWDHLGRVFVLVDFPSGLPREAISQLNAVMRIFSGDASVVIRVEDGKLEDALMPPVRVEPSAAFEGVVRALGGGIEATVFRR